MTTDPGTGPIDPAQPRTRRRLSGVRVSVRALMGAVLVLAVGLGFYVRSVHIQQDAVAAIRRTGGSVIYDWRWGDYNPDIIDNDGKWRAPKWLARLVPVDYVANAVYVSLVPSTPRRRSTGRSGTSSAPPGVESLKPADDETLAHVGRLRHLNQLVLTGTAITDAGLGHLKDLTGLLHLSIDRTMVGDTGLAHLKGLSSLSSVYISGDRISDEARLDVERALPNVWINHQDEMASSDISQRARDDLDFVRSRSVRQASALLVDRARFMIPRHDTQEVIATVEALCDLEAGDKLSLIKLAENRARCIGLLQPSHAPDIPAAERERLLRRCADRGIDALTRAVELGYDNARRLEGNLESGILLRNLHDHPAFPKLIEAMKANRSAR